MILLNTPIVITQTATKIQITEIQNNIGAGTLCVRYSILLDDDTYSSGGSIIFRGYDEVKALYAELDEILETGKTFEEASVELLYEKVLISLNFQ